MSAVPTINMRLEEDEVILQEGNLEPCEVRNGYAVTTIRPQIINIKYAENKLSYIDMPNLKIFKKYG